MITLTPYYCAEMRIIESSGIDSVDQGDQNKIA